VVRKVKIKCHLCHQHFQTKRAYFTFNKEAGYNSFCSKKCHYKSKWLGKTLSCENPKCDKKFYRSLTNISAFNYCSKSCAAIINNQKFPKWPKRYCAKCKKEFKNRESKYCSWECSRSALYNNRGHIATKYTAKEIREHIKNLFDRLGRTPARRELGNMSYAAIRIFKSWNNAISAVGLAPNRSHDHRMYKRSKTKANDGHLCDSISESIIDNWLYKNKIKHSRNVSYPDTNHLADWGIDNNKTFIEYFGLAKDSPRYDRSIKEKIKICKKHKIKLIDIYPKDLYKTSNFINKLRFLKSSKRQ